MSERLNVYKRRIKKAQQGIKFVSYNVVEDPVIDYTDITNPINPFSEYYIPTTYNTEQALVVPEREDSKSDTVEETPAVASKPIAELVVNKPVASKVVVDNTANSTWSSPYKDRSKWAADLTNAYKRAGITNDNAIRMLVSQDALESAWGRSAQGKFNFGNLTTGAKWQGDYVTGNDHDAAGNPIKQKFRSYNSMDEYAADKVQFLKRLYDFDENDDINKFVAKLTGSNKGKRRYAEATNYANTLKKVYNSYRSGGIIKYQEPANGIQRRDATYVSPTYHNSPYRDVNYKPTSEIEIVSPKWTMQDGRLIKTTSQIKNRVIPLETVSPEFDVLTGIRGMASLLGNKPKPMIFKSNTSKLAKAERMGIPKGERNSPSPYKQIGTVDEVSEHYMKATGDIFGPFMDKQSEHAVFNHATDPSKIVKVYAVNDKGFADIAAIKEFQAHYMKRNQIPFGVKNRFSGYLKGKDGIFPVYTQDKVTPLKAMNNTQYEKEIFPKLVEQRYYKIFCVNENTGFR
ncbi:glucosaminidase domain-containing protein [Bacteroides uniformis]|uniref:glucosaminidase domain-containing protein n=1 Tax=Bacteroides uniformis TaxID=820 RepID=UPI001106C61B|nr:glucosaminidase domain-containing protein [Bacteroides uniformis]MDC1866147.1 glucosaminidase domain-containing protein [Bacteroides uniformis]MDC1870356.1 glucosaminidase domain-containing protein [Bacteroides uniformis]